MSLPSAKEVLEMLRTGAMDEPERLDGYDWVVICKALEARAVLEEAGREKIEDWSRDPQTLNGIKGLLRSLASTLDPQEEKP